MKGSHPRETSHKEQDFQQWVERRGNEIQSSQGWWWKEVGRLRGANWKPESGWPVPQWDKESNFPHCEEDLKCMEI